MLPSCARIRLYSHRACCILIVSDGFPTRARGYIRNTSEYIRIHQNTVFIENTPKSHRKRTVTRVGGRESLTTANRFVNKKQTGRHGGRRAVQHRYGVQTSRIRPIAFDIVKDVGKSGSGATVPPQPHPHVVREGGSRLRPAAQGLRNGPTH